MHIEKYLRLRNMIEAYEHWCSWKLYQMDCEVKNADVPSLQSRCKLCCFTGTVHNLFEGMQFVKIGGNLDANDNIVNYFHGIIAGSLVLYS